MERKPLTLAGIRIDNLMMDEALDMIFSVVGSGEPCRELHFVNAHCINVAYTDDAYRQVMQGAAAVFADGSGIRKAGEMLEAPIVDNVNGTDMFPLLCRRCLAEGKQIYLLGAEPGIAERTAGWVEEHIGDGIVAGCHDGFFTEEQAPGVIAGINDSGASILLAAMGVPRQELWIHAHLQQLQCPVAIGVGGLFDFFSGKIRRAPLFMRKLGIEWVWRLLMEPRRMWRRYVIGNFVFLRRMKRLMKAGGEPAGGRD